MEPEWLFLVLRKGHRLIPRSLAAFLRALMLTCASIDSVVQGAGSYTQLCTAFVARPP